MLQSKRISTLPIDSYGIDAELEIVDRNRTSGEYDAFTFGTWESHVLANSSGADDDTAFQPHENPLKPTELGRRLPGIMSLVENHFDTTKLQWIRIFGLSDGILAPHVDFLEFSEPGTRLQIPLRTTTEALHSENDIAYHLRRGEVWKIHTTVPHCARSGKGPARLSLCLDFAGDEDPSSLVRDGAPAEQDVHFADRAPLSDFDIDALIDSGKSMTRSTMRESFRRFAAVHFEYETHSTNAFDWFVQAAEKSGDAALVSTASAFKIYCVEKRAYRESFEW